MTLTPARERRPGSGAAPEISSAKSGIDIKVTAAGDNTTVTDQTAVYRPSPVKRSRRTNAQLDVIDDVILECLREEHPASLRGTYYRVMSAGVVDKTEAGYRLVGRQVLKLRRNGVLPYSWITDGTRWIVKPTTYDDVDQMLSDAAASYRRALWHSQPVNVHLFTEKEAISGVIDSVTAEYDVPLGVLRGYSSETFAWSVAETVAYSGKPAIFYQLGDHDPSGIDAWRNFADKVANFAPRADVTFERIAVLPEQIITMNLPTRPTKRSDTRSAGFSCGSVEVDAIAPSTLRTIVRDAIEQHVDPEKLRITKMIEAGERADLYRWVGGQS